MTADVAWPRAFKSNFIRGPEELRAYWTEQWAEINPHVEPLDFHQKGTGQIVVELWSLPSAKGSNEANAKTGEPTAASPVT